MSNIKQTYGVEYTIVQNLTGEDHLLAWFPAAEGRGRTIGARERIRFAGNLFEHVVGVPAVLKMLQDDIRTGKIAVRVCGELGEADYLRDDVLQLQTVVFDCTTWIWDSSSSSIIAGD